MKSDIRRFIIITKISTLIVISVFLNNIFAQDEEILTGVVKATDWQGGEVIAASLVITSDEEDEEGKLTTYIDEYQIIDDQMGKELFELDGEPVVVKGVFLEEDDGIILLKVRSYKLVDSNNENDSEEDEDPNDDYPEEEEPEEPPK